jgi:hypothetical protein
MLKGWSRSQGIRKKVSDEKLGRKREKGCHVFKHVVPMMGLGG